VELKGGPARTPKTNAPSLKPSNLAYQSKRPPIGSYLPRGALPCEIIVLAAVAVYLPDFEASLDEPIPERRRDGK
jgi:hypothetical protein